MCYLVFAHGAGLIRRNGDDRERLSTERHKLDLKGPPISIYVHDGADIPGSQSVLWKILRQNDSFMFGHQERPRRGLLARLAF